MSLDIMLLQRDAAIPAGSGIFVRESGRTVEITRAEWDAKFPGREPVISHPCGAFDEVFRINVTHNLAPMARAAGLYLAMWRPEELEAARADDIAQVLRDGLALLHREPERFRALNPGNGWGSYEGLVETVEKYLAACREHPAATIEVSR